MSATSLPLQLCSVNHTIDLQTAITAAEIRSLAHELCEAEGLTLANAMHQACIDLGILHAYAESWDRHAFLDGNDDALPF